MYHVIRNISPIFLMYLIFLYYELLTFIPFEYTHVHSSNNNIAAEKILLICSPLYDKYEQLPKNIKSCVNNE